ncbi:DNA topoisomerase 6 subunit B-like isoform X2 [Solanum tuberosum]|uniref:DNA topoisomerase 6 subunit B-like isoform X2 n=1 Tax=Solanum tuberosum TaxID=4113 RepID=UPI00073A2725|nr:PREDICTED: DNA topoisomerase 6 subunit B-like isoform X2 [Solanum tuberosum]
MRELVENADSAESISELPVVEITIEEIGRCKFNSMIGLADHERRDEALYDDFETSKAREDNGRGMPHDDILNMFRRVLSGTKYGLKQTRGKFGLGAKMALIWSKMSTGLSIEIKSSMNSENYTSFCRLDIDIYKYEMT